MGTMLVVTERNRDEKTKLKFYLFEYEFVHLPLKKCCECNASLKSGWLLKHSLFFFHAVSGNWMVEMIDY
ncbi:hypothetical protein HMPREF9012_0371 [Bacteroidetes bacterium oral taxon 272 str. F0290]|nr:hypothetical protein HMPREF9012_0371 [Bacteroidetes bacterium oral taxon 272 str. F0290]